MTRDVEVRSVPGQAQVASPKHSDGASETHLLPGSLTASHASAEIPNLIADHRRLEQELAAVRGSIGWRCIESYRRWLATGLGKRLRFLYEPILATVLGKIASPASAPESSYALRRLDGPVREPAGAGERGLLSYETWIGETEPSEALLAFQRQMSQQLSYRPLVTILLPVYRVAADVLRATVASVERQSYPNWELCIAHADPDAHENAVLLRDLSNYDPRIKVERTENRGISENSNLALAMGSGEFTALLDHDDTLAPSALFEVVRLLNDRPTLDFIYSDKDQLTWPHGTRVSPLLKPRWSPDVLLNANYLTHFTVIRSDLIRSIGGFRSETDGAQDWDLFLRVSERTDRIEHIPQVLYHWRQAPTSVAGGGYATKPYALQAQKLVVRSCLERCFGGGDVSVSKEGLLRVHWRRPAGRRVSVLILSEHGDAAAAVGDVRSSTGAPDLEVLVCAAGRAGPNGSELLEAGALAGRINRTAAEASGDFLVFVDENVRLGSADLIDELVGPLSNLNIGVVGPKLLFPDRGRIYQAGIAFDRTGRLCQPWSGRPDYSDSCTGYSQWYRNWLAVGGACFAMRSRDFRESGGFSGSPSYPRLDVDLCFRQVLDCRRRVLSNPFAVAYQYKPALVERWTSPSAEAAGAAYIRRSFPGGDPYLSPHVECGAGGFALGRRSGAGMPQPFDAESRAHAETLDASPALMRASAAADRGRSGRLRTITWFLPGFEHVYYGGVHTVFRFAEYLRREHGARSTFAMVGAENCNQARQRISEAYPELAGDCELLTITDPENVHLVPPADAAVATLWTTAYSLLRYTGTRNKLYLVQDYEPLFYPGGTTSALAEATYRFGFRGLCNTESLAEQYRAAGGEAEFFLPCVDGRVFFPPSEARPPSLRTQTLFWYARPAHWRNGFELLAAAMRRVKADLGERVRIVAAGSRWNPADYGLRGVVENLGLLGYDSTGALYRSSAAGVVMMATRHPSYVPLELMACGALVIANRNPYTEWLFRDGVNCLLADPCTPAAFAERMEAGLRDDDLRRAVACRAADMVADRFSDWDSQAERVYRYMKN
jgi:glycosyltransferase involved in cell wall biosynthesis